MHKYEVSYDIRKGHSYYKIYSVFKKLNAEKVLEKCSYRIVITDLSEDKMKSLLFSAVHHNDTVVISKLY